MTVAGEWQNLQPGPHPIGNIIGALEFQCAEPRDKVDFCAFLLSSKEPCHVLELIVVVGREGFHRALRRFRDVTKDPLKQWFKIWT